MNFLVVPYRDRADSIQVRPPASESAESNLASCGWDRGNKGIRSKDIGCVGTSHISGGNGMGSVDGMGCSIRSYGTTVQLETKAPALSKSNNRENSRCGISAKSNPTTFEEP